ncbi:restriction endonuclease subunit S [Helicobacter sp.]|uniref:restriction endonuclease subunit S n=1 Tax=Helicobacter sp. TaxID=218 RepID=UPI0025890046|nr:restriction endonuclease subunit S [Helicobacter sp.]MCI7765452.1 restriction endonuclease subunit S [Helicobacter sp.]
MTHLPQGWEVKKLNEIFNIERGGSPRPIKVFLTNDENGIPWIKIGDIKNQKYLYETEEKIIEEGLKKSKLVLSGDLLLSNSMSFGKPVIVKVSRGAIHDGWLLLREKLTLDKEYFYYLFSSNFMYSFLSSQASGTTVKNLNIDKLKNIEIPLPPLKEQGRIVGILDLAFEKIDTSVELLKANLANLDELAQSVLDRAFNPLEDSADSTESTQNPSTHDTQSPYPLPQHWEWKSLGEMCKILNGGTPDTKNPVFWDLNQSHEVQTDKSVVGVGGEVERGEGATSQFKPLHPLAKEKSYYWATLVDTKQKYLYSTQRKITQKGLDSSNATLLPVNSVIFSSRASIGEVCIAKVETATNQGYKNFVCDENVLYYEFLYFALQRFAKEIESLAQGTTYKEVSKAKISEFQIPLPKDIKEQEQIAKHLDSTFERIKKLKELYNAQLQDYEELKQSLLTQAFSGKL